MPHQSTNKVYSNCAIYHPDGTFMCWCGSKRMKWYLKKELAVEIADNKIQLSFEPAGYGHNGDDYYMEKRVNECVVCGATDKLTKHHVVPHQYRRHMSEKHKSHTHYDVLCVCADCHEKYEAEAMKLNKELMTRFKMSQLTPEMTDEEKRIKKVMGYIGALQKHWKSIPEDRREVMLDCISDHMGYEVSLADIDEITIEHEGPQQGISPGGFILNAWIEEQTLQDFVVMWRKHFLEKMNPKFISELWINEHETREY